jgi:hypothetical protein
MPPAPSTTRITTGWSRTARLITTGCNTWPSNCCTAKVTPTTARAVSGPRPTRATSADSSPAPKAPTRGRKAPTKVSRASDKTRGTPSTSRPMAMNAASNSPTIATPRM